MRWVGRWGENKRRPPSVTLCAVIGEAPRGDCATEGHLQATMTPFVQPLASLTHYHFPNDRLNSTKG